ncbi:helix-turn-helix transcriptional regulator [Klebsiella pneumoniae]|nr:helix-turn-helix transcriptional regulator [Klebsiella pneumoniae]
MSNFNDNNSDLKLSWMIRDWIPTWEHLENPCGAKNLQSQFVYANPAYKRLLALPSNFNVEGRFDHEMPAPTAEFADDFRYHDRLVEELGDRRSSLEINEFGPQKQLSAYFFDKFPIYGHDNNILGTFFFGRRAVFLDTEFYLNGGRPDSIILTKPSDIFSEQQWEVIFLLMRGFSNKQIASKLQRSVDTIKTHLKRIMEKANVNNRGQLIEFIDANGWSSYVPEKYMRSRRHILFH